MKSLSPRQPKALLGAKKVALIAVMTATLEAGKLALAWATNVEIVTLLCGVYGYVFGPIGLLAIGLFVVIESLIWGFNTWILSYIIYWPMVCLVFWLLGKFKVKNIFLLTLSALLLTVWFGVLTSLIDVGLFMGFYQNFWKRFSIYYMRGLPFYAVHVACNLCSFLLLFKPMANTLQNLKIKFLGESQTKLLAQDNPHSNDTALSTNILRISDMQSNDTKDNQTITKQ